MYDKMLFTVLSLCALVVQAFERDCGVTIYESEVLITGGRPARRGEVPWHVGIYRKTSTTYNQICGGSLISHSVIISAAHCFWNGEEVQPLPEEFAAAVGKIYSNWESNRTGEDDQKSDVKKMYLPDYYLGSDTNYQDDISVVVVTSPFKYTKYVRPVCVHFDIHLDKRQLQPGNYGKVAGWGLTEVEESSQILRLIELPFIDIKRCFMLSPFVYLSQITSDKFCAGYKNSNKAVCKGDSGEGLAFPLSENGRTRYYLRGVVSSAPGTDERCNTKDFTLFTHLLNHEHFIKEILELDQIQPPKVPNVCNSLPSAMTAHKTGRRAWDKCIEYQERLVFPCTQNATGGNARTNRCHQNDAGNDELKNEFPYFVWIASEKNVSDFKDSCWGTLISETFVLTSARCIYWQTRSGGTLYVVFGMSSNSKKLNDLTHFKIKHIHNIPPKDKYQSHLNDIALLQLEEPVTLSEFLVPACLHTGDTIEDDSAVTVYWRSKLAENSTLSYDLQKLLVTKSSDCAEMYIYKPYTFDISTQLCYKSTDSLFNLCEVVPAEGSPLQVRNKNIACMNTIVGVTAITKLCSEKVFECSVLGSVLRCDPYAWVYTRVASYIDWIENIVWP